MLNLQTKTPQRWLDQVDQHLDEILLDHAICEMKAAATAMNLMVAYVEDQLLCQDLSVIVREELGHFHQVLEILKQRGIRFQRTKPGGYGKKLHQHIRKGEPDRAVDRMLVSALIEARSCERFDLLARHLEDRELAQFLGGLFETEARHYATYVRLAGHFAESAVVQARLRELAAVEAEIVRTGDPLPRVHS